MSKFKIGDKVRIINYGHPIWENKKYPEYKPMSLPTISETENVRWCDMRPDLVGREDIVDQVTNTQGRPKYSLLKNGAWFLDENLEMVNKNPNT